jgi:cytochrome c
VKTLLVSLLLVGATHTPAAPVREDAVALVKRGIETIRAYGPELGHALITGGQGGLAAPGLHLVVYDLDGRCLAHGAHPSQVGQNLAGSLDLEGRYFVRERLLLVQAQPGGIWQEYQQANLQTKQVEARLMYCEKLGDTAVCSGVRR